MKLLYLTDTHIRGTSPKSRLDDYCKAMSSKLEEIKSLIQEFKVDYVLHGGDVFDKPNISPTIVLQFVKIFREYKVPIYVIAGNHDIYGHNPLTVKRTMLGLLDAFGVVKLLDENDRILLTKDDVTVQLTGQPFHYDLDRRDFKKDYHRENLLKAKYCIHMVHGMLVEKPLPDSVAYTLVDDVWCKDIDILLTGHYHTGFKLKYKDGRYIINPGALGRINNNISEIKRIPQIVLITLSKNISVDFIPLKCAKKGEEVLDRSYIEDAVYKQAKLASFIQQIQTANDFSSIQILDILEDIAKTNNLDDVIKNEAMKFVALSEEEEARNEIF